MSEGITADAHVGSEEFGGSSCSKTVAVPLPRKGSDEVAKAQEHQCAVCWGPLIEPVTWPSCPHHYCLVCSLRIRQRPRPTCPLCRSVAPRLRKSSELEVDADRAAQVRQHVGYSCYETHRREVWAEAASLDSRGGLGEMHLFSMGMWNFPEGAQQRLRIYEPRYREMVERALAPGGGGKFGVVLCPAEFQAGARGRVCEILESERGQEGDWHVLVEGGAAFQLLDVTAEELQSGDPPLYRGLCEEVDEEELASLGESWTPLAAANEMVNILSVLGRHLRSMRRHRHPQGGGMDGSEEDQSAADDVPAELRAALASGNIEGLMAPTLSETVAAMTPLAAAAAAAAVASPQGQLSLLPPEAGAGGDDMAFLAEEDAASTADGDGAAAPAQPEDPQDVGAMVNLLMAYRQIITEMDRLLVQASRTAERLGISETPQLPSPPAVAPPPAATSRAPSTAASPTRQPPSVPPARNIATAPGHASSLPARSLARAVPNGGSGALLEMPANEATSSPLASSQSPAAVQPQASTGTRAQTAVGAAVNGNTSWQTWRTVEDPTVRFRNTTQGFFASRSNGWSMWPSVQRTSTASGSQVRAVTAASRTTGNAQSRSNAGSLPARLPSTSLRASTAAGPRAQASVAFRAGTAIGSRSSLEADTRRPATTTRAASTGARNAIRQPAPRTTSTGLGPLEDRPPTQAEALQLRSGTDWRPTGSLADSRASLPLTSGDPRAQSRQTPTRRPRQALFSQAARFAFPGRRNAGS